MPALATHYHLPLNPATRTYSCRPKTAMHGPIRSRVAPARAKRQLNASASPSRSGHHNVLASRELSPAFLSQSVPTRCTHPSCVSRRPASARPTSALISPSISQLFH